MGHSLAFSAGNILLSARGLNSSRGVWLSHLLQVFFFFFFFFFTKVTFYNPHLIYQGRKLSFILSACSVIAIWFIFKFSVFEMCHLKYHVTTHLCRNTTDTGKSLQPDANNSSCIPHDSNFKQSIQGKSILVFLFSEKQLTLHPQDISFFTSEREFKFVQFTGAQLRKITTQAVCYIPFNTERNKIDDKISKLSVFVK